MVVTRLALLSHVSVAALMMLSTSCSGGGGGGAAGDPAAPVTGQMVVSGTVQAPSGQVAMFRSQRVRERAWATIFPEAIAGVTGMSAVADGTTIQLIRINEAGSVVRTLASTAVSGGRYSFNLTNLGVTFSSDLAVRVSQPGTNVQMRAFVVNPTVHLDPVSESAVRLVLGHIALTPGTMLTNFTSAELRDMTGGVNQVATAKHIIAGLNVESTVSSIMNAAQSEPSLTSFLAAAAGLGTTTEGPGDIGNYVPLHHGRTWKFQGSYSVTGQPTVPYSNSVTVNVQKAIGAVTARIVAESNPLNSGSPEEVYYIKDSKGVTYYGNNDVADPISAALAPYREIFFPLQPDVVFESLNKQHANLGRDLDADGKNETADVLSETTVESFEDVAVPKGTFLHTAKIVTKTTVTVFSSAGLGSETVAITQTTWLASNVGRVKRITNVKHDDVSETATEELIDVFVANQLSLATNDLVYDSHTGRIYASIPGSPGGIQSIDPVTGALGTVIPVGNEPLKLAMSDDGQYLYVGLDGEGAVQRVNLASQTLGPKFVLGSDASLGPFYVEDMEVLPGNPNAVAISRKYKGVSPRHAGVAIFDNGVQRPNVTPTHTGSNTIVFSASAETLYGYNNETTEFGFRRMTVSSTGVTIADTALNLINNPADIAFDHGLIYASTGPLIDPVLRTRIGTVPISPGSNLNPSLVRPDINKHRIYVYQKPDSSADAPGQLLTFNATTLQQLGSLEVENVSGQASSLIRWGSHGLAFRTTGGQVMLIESVEANR